MNNNDVIFDLAEWLDTHLDMPLSLDVVAAKSGYSKWHLQRIFKEITGCRLGQYIRSRRLSWAATELRMTRTPILSIALKYHFDTQQTFSRAFKQFFRQSPGAYRNSDEWDCSLLYPPLKRSAFPVPRPSVITLPQRLLAGMKHSYTCRIENINRFDMAVRRDFWRRHFRHTSLLPPCVYGLSDIGPYGSRRSSELEIIYTTAVEMSLSRLSGGASSTAVLLEGGEYLQFDYAGPAEGLQQFIITINQYHLPQLKAVRRKGADIERYRFPDEEKSRAGFIHCSYLVPCANAGEIGIRRGGWM